MVRDFTFLECLNNMKLVIYILMKSHLPALITSGVSDDLRILFLCAKIPLSEVTSENFIGNIIHHDMRFYSKKIQ